MLWTYLFFSPINWYSIKTITFKSVHHPLTRTTVQNINSIFLHIHKINLRKPNINIRLFNDLNHFDHIIKLLSRPFINLMSCRRSVDFYCNNRWLFQWYWTKNIYMILIHSHHSLHKSRKNQTKRLVFLYSFRRRICVDYEIYSIKRIDGILALIKCILLFLVLFNIGIFSSNIHNKIYWNFIINFFDWHDFQWETNVNITNLIQRFA